MTTPSPAQTASGQTVPSAPPSVFQASIRSLSHRLPDNWLGRRLASVALRAAGGTQTRAFEVDLFEGQRARLHPFDNISEKRVFITEQFWERPERAALDAVLTGLGETVRFADVGANAGLYTLYVAARCDARGQALRSVLVEPDPVMHARAEANLALSGIEAEVLPWAAAAAAGPLQLTLHGRNRGENTLVAHNADPSGERIHVAARPLGDVFARLGGAPDVMKMDIEGAEEQAVRGMIEACDASLWPRFIQMEGAREGRNDGAIRRLMGAGYELHWEGRGNLFLRRTS